MRIIFVVFFSVCVWAAINSLAAVIFAYTYATGIAAPFGLPTLQFWQSFCLLTSATIFGCAFGTARVAAAAHK